MCDGFAGNVMLKLGESFHHIYKQRGLQDDYFDRLNFEEVGGTPIVGINANVVVAHGISKRIAIKNMILRTREVASANLAQKLREGI